MSAGTPAASSRSGSLAQDWGLGRPLARCPGVLFQRPPTEPDGPVSEHPALRRLLRVGCSGVSGMDGGVAGLADHEGLPSPPRHEAHPGRGVGQPRWVELGERADVVDLDVLGPRAELTLNHPGSGGGST
jgi:hypothetical protein